MTITVTLPDTVTMNLTIDGKRREQRLNLRNASPDTLARLAADGIGNRINDNLSHVIKKVDVPIPMPTDVGAESWGNEAQRLRAGAFIYMKGLLESGASYEDVLCMNDDARGARDPSMAPAESDAVDAFINELREKFRAAATPTGKRGDGITLADLDRAAWDNPKAAAFMAQSNSGAVGFRRGAVLDHLKANAPERIEAAQAAIDRRAQSVAETADQVDLSDLI